MDGRRGLVGLQAWLQGRGEGVRQLSRRLSQRAALALTLVVLLLSGTLADLGTFGVGVARAAQAQGMGQGMGQGGDHPTNRFDPQSQTTSVPPKRPKAQPGTEKPHKPIHIGRPTSGSMATGTLALHPDQPGTFLGSDGRLEVDVPAGAVTTEEVGAAGGALQLRIAQVNPASGSSNGGVISFGTYLIQVVDKHGVLVGHGLHPPVTVKLHTLPATTRPASPTPQ